MILLFALSRYSVWYFLLPVLRGLPPFLSKSCDSEYSGARLPSMTLRATAFQSTRFTVGYIFMKLCLRLLWRAFSRLGVDVRFSRFLTQPTSLSNLSTLSVYHLCCIPVPLGRPILFH